MAVLVVDSQSLREYIKHVLPSLDVNRLASILIPHWEREVARRTAPIYYLPIADDSFESTLSLIHISTTENIITLAGPERGAGATLLSTDVFSPAPSLIDVEMWTVASAKRVFGTDPRWAYEYLLVGNKAQARQQYNKRWEFVKTTRSANLDIREIAQPAPSRLCSITGVAYQTITTESQLEELVDILRHEGRFAFDTETTGLKVRGSKLVGISISATPGHAFYIPVGHNEGQQLALSTVADALRDVFEDSSVKKYGHKISFDINFLRYHLGVDVKGIAGDSKTLAWMLGYGGGGGHLRYDQTGLKMLAKKRLSIEMMEFATTVAGRGNAANTPIDKMTQYACADADMTLRLVDLLEAELPPAQLKRYKEMELPFLRVVSDIEMRGVYVNSEKLKALDNEFRFELLTTNEKIRSIVGDPEFNPNSPAQVSKYLFSTIGLPPTRRTKTGYSTDANALEALRDTHPVVNLLSEGKQIAKLIGTYTSGYPEYVDPTTRRIHSLLSATGTLTGRISSSEPNVMNVPVRTKRGAKLREAFEGQGDNYYLGADYSQIEPRVLAHMCEDPFLIQIFQDGIDLYRAIGGALWHKPLDDITKQERDAVKVFWLAATYLVGVTKLSEQLSRLLGRTISNNEAASYLSQFYTTVPKVREFQQEMVEVVRTHGYVETLLGFRIPVEGIDSPIEEIKAYAHSRAVDVGIQGTASGDIMKLAMIQLGELARVGTIPPMVLQVHDELIFEGEYEWLKSSQEIIQHVMESVVQLRVPLVVEPKLGKTWADAKG